MHLGQNNTGHRHRWEYPEKVSNLVTRQEGMSSNEQLRTLGLPRPEKRRPRGPQHSLYLPQEDKKDGKGTKITSKHYLEY